MKIFQNSVLNKYLKTQDEKKIDEMYSQFTSYFHNAERQVNIRNSKEEQFQEGFLRELFVKILGYTLNPEPNFNLTTELKNEKGAKKTDGAILKNGKALAVIELKGTDTKDLDKVNEQAFNYKNNHTDCIYVITSNFEKLRFFIHNAVTHIEFNLFTLTKDEFKILWLCLNAENLLGGVPAKIKGDSIIVEENVTKQLYKDYSTFKTELWQNICKNRPDLDKLLLFKKTQKLLDRFLFVFFAEDSGLLPPNSITRMVERYHRLIEDDAEKPLYEIFKQYFDYINKGRKGKTAQDDIFAYNGGLFVPDEILDSLIIDDKILKPHVLKMTAYDFQSDVDVNILGHIFENSLNEIENVTAQLERQEVDKSKTKRKKDGVFYTPKYITKYIVENTVGKLCEEKKTELQIIDEEYAKGRKNRKKKTLQTLYDNLQAYRNWLLELTICDPACGSGAFLNQALEFLINEHAYIDELQANLLEASMILQDVSNHVLEKNIFGVDINDESVEIAKLSLWLRTAQRGRKLTSLNNNIKCGNSLIDDPEIAGEKAFKWQNEFPQIFEKGGFDVIIGNPPYVRVQNLDYKTIDFYKNNFTVSFQRIDLYLLFFEKAYSLLNKTGVLSFINPTMFVNSDYGIGLRKFLKNKGLTEIVDFGDLAIFEDAITYTGIFTLSKQKKNNYKYIKIHDISTVINILNSSVRNILNINDLSDSGWSFSAQNELILIDKLNTNSRISDIAIINSGCFTGFDGAFFVTDDEIKINNLEIDLIYPVIMGKEPKRYHLHNPIKKSIYPYKNVNGKTELIHESELQQDYPNIYSFLLKNKLKLLSRKDSRKTFGEMGRPWYSYTRKGLINVFEKNKILVGYIVNSNTYCLDMNKYMFSVGRVFSIVPLSNDNTKGLLALLNSKVSYFLMKLKCPIKKGGYFKISSKYLADFRIPKKNKLKLLDKFADKQINHNSAYNILLLNFVHLLEQKFNIICKTKLENWNKLEFVEFLKELEKARKKSAKENKQEYKKLKLSEEAEWLQYFNKQKQKAQDYKSQINQTDKEIDKMVYELYELTDEEIKIVENSVK